MQLIAGSGTYTGQLLGVLLPELFGGHSQRLNPLDFVFAERRGKGFAPLFKLLEGGRLQRLDHLVTDHAHAFSRQQKVEYISRGRYLRKGQSSRRGGSPVALGLAVFALARAKLGGAK